MLEGTAVLWEEFQSTLPVRGATKPGIQRIRIKGISIHAPREGSDEAKLEPMIRQCISIHAPREGSDFRTMPPLR